jgi:hypothetical protein
LHLRVSASGVAFPVLPVILPVIANYRISIVKVCCVVNTFIAISCGLLSVKNR